MCAGTAARARVWGRHVGSSVRRFALLRTYMHAPPHQPPDGIETCGVLAGVQDQGQVRFITLINSNTSLHTYVDTLTHTCTLYIHTQVRFTTLIIPKQEGTSDTVGTTHEEELFFHCEAHGLIMLGWIHTHPSQACFMSSVDIHTHCGYQTMLPEVRAPVRVYQAWLLFF